MGCSVCVRLGQPVQQGGFGGPMHGANESAPVDALLQSVKIYVLALLRLEEIDF